MGAEERRGGGGPGGKPGRGARPFSRLSAYSSLRRLSFPSEPCGRRSSSRGGAGAGWSEEPGSPSSRGVALPLGRAGAGWRSGLGWGWGARAGPPGAAAWGREPLGAQRLEGQAVQVGGIRGLPRGRGAGWAAIASLRPEGHQREWARRGEAGGAGPGGAGRARPAEGPWNAGDAGPGGAGLRGPVHAWEGVGTGKGRPEGLAGVTRQTMSRWCWVVLGNWAVTNRI